LYFYLAQKINNKYFNNASKPLATLLKLTYSEKCAIANQNMRCLRTVKLL